MSPNKPIFIFRMVEAVIRSHQGEKGVCDSSGNHFKAITDWESPERFSENWQYLLSHEKAANQILWHLYRQVDKEVVATSPMGHTLADYTRFTRSIQQYPAAQLLVNLRRLEAAIKSSFRLKGNNVEFPRYLTTEDFLLITLMETLLGEDVRTPSGLPTITGHNPCSIPAKHAEKFAPLLELNLSQTPPLP